MVRPESCHFVNAKYYYVTDTLWRHARRTVSSPHNLILVTEGTLYVEMEGVRYAVNQGEFLYLPHGVESTGYRPSTTHTAFYFVLFKANDSVGFPTHFAVTDMGRVSEMYALLIKRSRDNNYPRQALDMLMRVLFYEVIYQLSHTGERQERTLAESIKKYSRDTAFRNMTIHDVAVHFGFSDDYINRVFTQSEHITLKAYINEVKVKKIEELLISTNTPLKTVAEKLGFSSSAALSKFYKYHTGKTISEYRSKFID